MECFLLELSYLTPTVPLPDSPSLSESIQSDPEVWLRIHSPSTLNIDTADLEKRGSGLTASV